MIASYYYLRSLYSRYNSLPYTANKGVASIIYVNRSSLGVGHKQSMSETCALPSHLKYKNKKSKKRKRSPAKSNSLPSSNLISNSDSNHVVAPVKSTEFEEKSNQSKVDVARSGKYPYPTDYNDHFEYVSFEIRYPYLRIRAENKTPIPFGDAILVWTQQN